MRTVKREKTKQNMPVGNDEMFRMSMERPFGQKHGIDFSQTASQVAHFSEISFMHIVVPSVVWDLTKSNMMRSELSIIFTMRGTHQISTTDTVLNRDPGISVICPGRSPLEFAATSPVNEFMVIQLGPRLYSDILSMKNEPTITTDSLSMDTIEPLFAFATSICEVHDIPAEIVPNLESVAQDIGKSLLSSVLGIRRNILSQSVYDAAHEYIARFYSNQGIGVNDAARYLGISVRKLQADLKKEGTGFSTMLRQVRAEKAKQLHCKKPFLTMKQVMQACGFGSYSSLYRAMNEYERQLSGS